MPTTLFPKTKKSLYSGRSKPLQKAHSLGRSQRVPTVAKLLVLQQFLEGFTPVMALYAIMFERVGGLDLQQIGWLFSIWALAYLLAELPSGVLADYWSRRNVIAVGGLLRAAGFAAWLTWPGFTGYAIGFALWGIALACSSGAVAAYLQNELKMQGAGKQFARYFGWAMSALSLGMLAGYVIAAVLTLEYTNLLIGLGAVSSLAYAAVLWGAAESPYKRQDSYLKTLKAGAAEILVSKKLRHVCYVLFAVYMIIGVLEELLPRLYADLGLSDSWVSIVLALSLVASTLLLIKLEWFVHFSLLKQMLIMGVSLGLLLAGLFVSGWGAVMLIASFSLIFHIFRPVFIHHVQEVTKGDEKSTVSSIPGLAAGFFSVLAYAAIGAGAQASSERLSIGGYGLIWLVILTALAYAGRKYTIRERITAQPQAQSTIYDTQK